MDPPRITLNSKEEDDVDLDSLIQEMQNESNLVKSPQHTAQSSCGEEELLVLHGSSESLASNEGDQHTAPKANFFDKQFLKSLPMAIIAKRKILGANNELTIPVSNTFHSLPGTPRLSRGGGGSFSHKKPDRLSAKAPKNGMKSVTWNVWISDLGAWKEVAIYRSSSCAILLHAVLNKLDRGADLTQWSIIEQNSEELIERFVEDFETLDEINPSRDSSNHISRFCLNRTPGKYMILDKPEHCLPSDMLTYPPGSKTIDNVPETEKRRHLQDILTKTAPEMCGWLHIRDPIKKSWKKVYCILRNSGFYYSNKNSNKEQQHLVCLAEIHTARVWFPINNKKQLSHSPTPHCFCLKLRTHHHESIPRWFCAETSQLKIAWINGLRLTLNGNKFHESYFSAQNNDPSNLIRCSSDRAINKCDSNFVPMDFSGSRGRVIKDPLEVAMVEIEQQSSWKKRLKHRISNASATLERGLLGSSAPSKSSGFLSRSIHKTQPWFYGKITREAAADEIHKHGSLDGTFLLRESRTIPGSVVITVCYGQKSRHIPVTRIEKNGQLYFTCDNGETRFLDLIQLVDFHRLNKGSLPSPLLHECSSK